MNANYSAETKPHSVSSEAGVTPSQPGSFQLRRILVPVDFSASSKKALQYAAGFSAAFAPEIHLLHVVQVFTVPPELGYMPPELPNSQQELVAAARSELEKLCPRDASADGRFQISVRAGVPWQEIADAARETDADLIILATHGHTGLKHVLLGSIAERVVRYAPCPVLIVRERERDFIAQGKV